MTSRRAAPSTSCGLPKACPSSGRARAPSATSCPPASMAVSPSPARLRPPTVARCRQALPEPSPPWTCSTSPRSARNPKGGDDMSAILTREAMVEDLVTSGIDQLMKEVEAYLTPVSIGKVHLDPELVHIGDGYVAMAGSDLVLAATTPAQVAHPLGPPTSTGTKITVDTMLKQYSRITRMIMDMTRQRFVADRIFASGGGVAGGAVVFDSVEANDLYTDRDVERISPGAEFPIVTSSRRAPGVAEV